MADRLVPWRLSLLVIFATTVLLANLPSAMSAQICYGIDGSQNTALPCDPNDASGPCCDLGWICLSNGLCRPGPDVKNNGNTNFYRPAGCTDPLWNSTSCFNGCNNFGGNGLQSCNAGKFCCADFGGCNCSSTSLFNLGTASFVTTLPLTPPTPTPSTSSTPASTPATTTSGSSPSASHSAPTSPLAASPSPSQPAPSEKSNGAAIGAGIGVGLGVPIIALAIILYILVRRHKKKSAGPQYHAASYAPTQEMEAPPVVHEAPSYQKYAHHQSPAPVPAQAQELDSSGMTFTPGVGWHK